MKATTSLASAALVLLTGILAPSAVAQTAADTHPQRTTAVLELPTLHRSVYRIKLPAKEANRRVFVNVHRRVWWNCPTDRSALTHGGCGDAKDLASIPGNGTTKAYLVGSRGRLSVKVPYDLCAAPSKSAYPKGIFITQVMVKHAAGSQFFYTSAYSTNHSGVADIDKPYWDYTYGNLYPFPTGRTTCR